MGDSPVLWWMPGCPLYPQKRTCSASASMSAKCQKRTSAGYVGQLDLGRPEADLGYSSPEAKGRSDGDRSADKADGKAPIDQISRRKQGRVHEQAAEEPGKERRSDISRLLPACRIYRVAPPSG